MKKKLLIIGICILPIIMQAQITIQGGAGMYLQENTELTVQGDFETFDNVEGRGFIILNGSSLQLISTHNKTLPALSLENNNGGSLTSSLKISKAITLTSGLLQLGRNDLELGSEAMAAGSASSYIVTDDAGMLIKSIKSHLSAFIVPIGSRTAYAPLVLQSDGKYQDAWVAISANEKIHPNKPPSSRDYLNNYWAINRTGITGNLTATAFYGSVTGNEENIQPYFWNGHEWRVKHTPVDTRNKLLHIDVPEGSGEIYAMRKGDELIPAASSMMLLPNPVHNTATLMIRSPQDENVVLRIMNNAGATVITQRVILRKGMNQVSMNVMSLANGKYVISSTQKDGKAINMIKQ